MAGCMLYWAEGAKERNVVKFANSDAAMVRFFVRFLREGFEFLLPISAFVSTSTRTTGSA